MTRDEELELHGLVVQAWELRDGPYLLDAVGALVEWYERRGLRWLIRRQERQSALVRLMRETRP